MEVEVVDMERDDKNPKREETTEQVLESPLTSPNPKKII